MDEMHYNILSQRTQGQGHREVLETEKSRSFYNIITTYAMFNNVEHQLLYKIHLHHIVWETRPCMFYKGGSNPHKYNERYSIIGDSVTKNGTILCNLGYIGCNPRSSSKSIETSRSPTMQIYELKSNIEGIHKSVNE